MNSVHNRQQRIIAIDWHDSINASFTDNPIIAMSSED